MIDIQNQPDFRKIPIDKVGIKGLKYPVKVLDKTTGLQSTVAQISMYVDLPHLCKGTHLSRFVETPPKYHHPDLVDNIATNTYVLIFIHVGLTYDSDRLVCVVYVVE